MRVRVGSKLVPVWLVLGLASSTVAGQEPPAPPRDLSVVRVEGQAVTLSWTHASPGDSPDSYVVEGGFAPGETWASAALPGAAISATFMLADNVYFARVHAVHGGLRTPASNEVRIVVGPVRAPSPPAAPAALAIGTDVTLAWEHTYEGGSASEVLLDVSGPIETTFVLPATGPVAFSAVPHGTYSVRLRARNAAGVSEPSSPVTMSVPGARLSLVEGPPHDADAPRLPVRYETFTTPRLAEFAARERLDAVLAGVSSEFEGILRLKDWVAAQWPVGLPNPYPPWDAMIILDMIRAGETGGFCGQYSQVYLQALAAYGIPARYVEMGTAENPIAHFSTEVWSNDFNKWVLMDAHFNLHFERDGVPQSALQVHEAFVLGEDGDLAIVPGTVREGHPDPRDPLEHPNRTAELYYYLRYHLKANHIAVPDEASGNRYDDAIEWIDEHIVPWELSTVPSELPHVRPTRVVTGDRALLEWRPNQVWITPRRTGPMQYTLDLQHTVLQLGRFEYRVIDDADVPGPWQSQASPQVVWTIGPRDRRLEVRGVNVRGIAGPASAVAIVP